MFQKIKLKLKVNFNTNTIKKHIPKMTTTTYMKKQKGNPKPNLDVSYSWMKNCFYCKRDI